MKMKGTTTMPTALKQPTYTPDALLNVEDAAEVLNLKSQTLNEWRTRRVGPPFCKLGRSVRYRMSDLTLWVDAQRINTL
jgi:predicted DNA-binding transcriptional regulator AlpA